MIQPAFASSSLETLQTRARQQHLGSDPYWHRLLHYRRNLLGVYQSEIDDPSFFLSARGRKDPATELDATLRAFFAPIPQDPEEQQAQCRFPARYAWLKRKLQIDSSQLQEVSCPRFEKWKAQMDPGSLSLVFASYYMNNPASTYGHTFLRLNAKGHTPDQRLLDYAVNYAADLESDNGVLFALKGLWGGYHGHFSTFPYYMKVQEYNNLEARDLWEYDMNVSSADLDRLVQHLWEMGNIRSRYFFINKNCSYYLMPVLDVMDPTLSLSRRFLLKTIPMDTVRQVVQVPGMVKNVSYRPSHATKMVVARKRLNREEVRLAERAAEDPAHVTVKDLAFLSKERQAMLLDSAYDLFRYQVGFTRGQPTAVQEKEKSLLLLRNQLGVPSSALELSSTSVTAPHLGHKTGRVDLSYGFSNRSHFEEISIHPKLHILHNRKPAHRSRISREKQRGESDLTHCRSSRGNARWFLWVFGRF